MDGKTVRPKVIASTATIRRAESRCTTCSCARSRSSRRTAWTPTTTSSPASAHPATTTPGRRYLGICAPGRALKAVLIRVYVAFMAAAQKLYEKYGAAADPWMTLVGYFNSMRELGGMRRARR